MGGRLPEVQTETDVIMTWTHRREKIAQDEGGCQGLPPWPWEASRGLEVALRDEEERS